MIELTPAARERVLAFMGEEPEAELALRFELLDSSPLAPRYDLSLVETGERREGERALDGGGFPVFVREDSLELLDGARIDWTESLQESGFRIENPNIHPIGSQASTGPLADRVRSVIDQQINPSIASHGGHVALVEIRDRIAYLRMSGGCQGCGMAAATLQQGIRRLLGEAVPEIEDIVDVTDHAAGTDPYYRQPA